MTDARRRNLLGATALALADRIRAAVELTEAPTTGPSLEELIAERERHRERRATLAALKPTGLQALWLQGAGYSHTEIAQLTGATVTAVNRRLMEGRAGLRRAA